MKVLKISGSNITSLGEFEIDFESEPLASAGTFAITGPTGAGKSSILDSLCLALFYKVPRLQGAPSTGDKFAGLSGEYLPNDTTHLIRRGESTARAEVEFLANDGLIYKSTWIKRQARKNVKEETYITRVHDDKILEDKKSKCEELNKKLVGLDFEKFTKTVLLAQGKFASFLQAKEMDDRAKILEQITGAELYSKIGERISQRNSQEKKKLESLRDSLEGQEILSDEEVNGLNAEIDELKKITKELDAPLKALENSIGLNKKSVELKSKISELEEEHVSNNEVLQKSSIQLAELKEAVSEIETLSKNSEPAIEKATSLDLKLLEKQNAYKEKNEKLKSKQSQFNELKINVDSSKAKKLNAQGEINTLEDQLKNNEHLKSLAEKWNLVESLLNDWLKFNNAVKEEADLLDKNKMESTSLKKSIDELILVVDEIKKNISVDNKSDVITLETELRKQLKVISTTEQIKNEETLLETKRSAIQQLLDIEEGLAKELALAEERLKISKDIGDQLVVSLRSKLVEGEACSVCGSESHPYASHVEEELKLQFETNKIQQVELNQKHRSAQENSSKNRLEIDSIKKHVAKLKLELEEIKINDLDIATLTDVDQINLKLEELEKSKTLLDEFILKNEKLSELKNKNEVCLSELKGSEQNFLKSKKQLEEIHVKIDETLNESVYKDWATQLASLNEEYIESINDSVELFNKQTQKLKELQESLNETNSYLKAREPQLEELEGTIEIDQKELDVVKEEGVSISSERKSLLDGKSVKEFKLEIGNAFNNATKKYESFKNEVQEKEKSQVEISTTLKNVNEQLKTNQKDLQSNFEKLKSIDEFNTIESMVDLTLIERLLSDFSSKKEQALIREGEINSTLESHQKSVTKMGAIQKEISAQQEVTGRFEKLHELLGKSEGRAFRLIAQQYTLQLLLEMANQKISEISPRYELQQQEGSLHFVIVDHDNFAMTRPVHTLSGGESFIISLSLALALSELASGEHSIETLFIDEGFGTLDPESLRNVMKALHNLQHQGRKVGLITHVEEMKERLPVRIEVSPQGHGPSEVKVLST